MGLLTVAGIILSRGGKIAIASPDGDCCCCESDLTCCGERPINCDFYLTPAPVKVNQVRLIAGEIYEGGTCNALLTPIDLTYEGVKAVQYRATVSDPPSWHQAHAWEAITAEGWVVQWASLLETDAGYPCCFTANIWHQSTDPSDSIPIPGTCFTYQYGDYSGYGTTSQCTPAHAVNLSFTIEAETDLNPKPKKSAPKTFYIHLNDDDGCGCVSYPSLSSSSIRSVSGSGSWQGWIHACDGIFGVRVACEDRVWKAGIALEIIPGQLEVEAEDVPCDNNCYRLQFHFEEGTVPDLCDGSFFLVAEQRDSCDGGKCENVSSSTSEDFAIVDDRGRSEILIAGV